MFVQADLEPLLINMMGLLVCGTDVCEWSMEIMGCNHPFETTIYLCLFGYQIIVGVMS